LIVLNDGTEFFDPHGAYDYESVFQCDFPIKNRLALPFQPQKRSAKRLNGHRLRSYSFRVKALRWSDPTLDPKVIKGANIKQE
jgi:hypothetical protein